MIRSNKYVHRSALSACLITSLLFAYAPTATADDAPKKKVDSYKAWPMLYGRESAPSDEITMTMGVEMQPTFTRYDRLGSASDKSEFSFQRLRWFMKGSITKDVDYLFISEWARNGITVADSGNGSAREFRVSATFRDLFDIANVQVGSMIVPFGHAFYVPAGTAPWVNYTRMQTNLYSCGSIGCPTEQGGAVANVFKTGVMAFDQIGLGDNSSLTYTAGVFNSTGIFQSDDGNNKDFNGSLEYHTGSLWAHYGIRLGNSKLGGAGPEFDRKRHALVLRYNDYLKDPWWVWGEYMMGTDETATVDTKAKGYELSTGYKFMPKWEIVARYSEYDPNTSVGNNDIQEISLGLTQSLDRGMRLQYQIDHARSDNKTVEDDIFTIRLTVPFAKKFL